MMFPQPSTTVGINVIIYGEQLMDIYEDAPGIACVSVLSTRTVDVSPLADLPTICAQALQSYCRLMEEHASAEPYDGLFKPTRIEVNDSQAALLALYTDNRWFTPTITPSAWLDMEGEIKALSTQAANELRYEKFSTAAQLSNQATLLSLKLGLSLQSA